MTTPIHSLGEIAGPGTAGKEEIVNEFMRNLEQGANWFLFVSRTTTAQPGSPADGDCYLIPASATGADWTGQDGKIAKRINTAWVFLAASEGMAAYVADEDTPIAYDGSAWNALRAYDIPLSFAGGPPAADEIIGAIVVPRTVKFAADFAGSAGYIGVNPTASFVISVEDDGVPIGTITVSTSGVFTFATTSGTAKTVAAGSRIEFVGPTTPDATAAYILATLKGFY